MNARLIAFLILTGAAWGEVDEPQSVYDSVGRTLWHFGRNAELIAKFHDFLRAKQVDPRSLLDKNIQPPQETRRILIEPELLDKYGWNVRGERIVSAGGRWGPGARVPVRIDRAGWYRCWIRYIGYKEGLAVTDFRIGTTLSDQFHGQVAGVDGPRWHDVMVYLDAGEHQLAFEHVDRRYQAPENLPYREHQIDCIYLTDEPWRDAPSDKERADLRARLGPDGAQRTETPALPVDEQER